MGLSPRLRGSRQVARRLEPPRSTRRSRAEAPVASRPARRPARPTCRGRSKGPPARGPAAAAPSLAPAPKVRRLASSRLWVGSTPRGRTRGSGDSVRSVSGPGRRPPRPTRRRAREWNPPTLSCAAEPLARASERAEVACSSGVPASSTPSARVTRLALGPEGPRAAWPRIARCRLLCPLGSLPLRGHPEGCCASVPHPKVPPRRTPRTPAARAPARS